MIEAHHAGVAPMEGLDADGAGFGISVMTLKG
jgi:hypothetical protein